MNVLNEIRAAFDVNWTTVLVGWQGLGTLSPWPDQWLDFPPLISVDEVASFAEDRFASTLDLAEQDLILTLIAMDLHSESRQDIRGVLTSLSDLHGGDPCLELRKWRVVLLEETLAEMSNDVVEGLVALTEFWLSFGLPSDSPHEVQGRGNALQPLEYYREENLRRLLNAHHAWIDHEKAALSGPEARP